MLFPEPPSRVPEWRRCGGYLLVATLLHAAVLLTRLRSAPPPQAVPPLTVKLVAPPTVVAAAPVSQPSPAAALPPPVAQRSQSLLRPAKAPPAKLQVNSPPVVNAPPPSAPGPSGPVPALPAATAAPLAQVAARFDAAYLSNPRPSYPPLSRRLGEEGKVLVRVRVGTNGLPLAVDLEKSSEFPRLDEAALDTVRRWRFIPARQGESAVESSVLVPIVFRLDA